MLLGFFYMGEVLDWVHFCITLCYFFVLCHVRVVVLMMRTSHASRHQLFDEMPERDFAYFTPKK